MKPAIHYDAEDIKKMLAEKHGVEVNGKWWHIDCTSGTWLTKKPWDHFTVMEMW